MESITWKRQRGKGRFEELGFCGSHLHTLTLNWLMIFIFSPKSVPSTIAITRSLISFLRSIVHDSNNLFWLRMRKHVAKWWCSNGDWSE